MVCHNKVLKVSQRMLRTKKHLHSKEQEMKRKKEIQNLTFLLTFLKKKNISFFSSWMHRVFNQMIGAFFASSESKV